MKIQILTDETSWMNKYNLILAKKFTDVGHEVMVFNSKDRLEKGDVAFFLSCYEIIGEEYLSLNGNNIVVHASKLPHGKGWSPLTWQILEGKNSIPLTLFEADKKCDSGIVYLRDTIEYNGSELIDELRHQMGEKIISLCYDFISNIKHIVGYPQAGEETFYPKRKAEDSALDIHKTILEQFDLLRVVDNDCYPAFFIKDGVKYLLKIEKEHVDEE